MTTVIDAPGMLRAKLHDKHEHGLPTVLVVAEHAERAAFARQALAVKLRELDTACTERDKWDLIAHNRQKECRELAINCQRYEADLEAAINGTLRKAT